LRGDDWITIRELLRADYSPTTAGWRIRGQRRRRSRGAF
jgi:hypothetical protein